MKYYRVYIHLCIGEFVDVHVQASLPKTKIKVVCSGTGRLSGLRHTMHITHTSGNDLENTCKIIVLISHMHI